MTVLVDTSVWIQYLKDVEPERSTLPPLLESGSAAITDVVLMELLVGPSDEARAVVLARFLAGVAFLPQLSPVDAESAAAIHRACRRAGETPRSRLNCIVAAVALRRGVPVLHRDRDFDVIARHTGLEVAAPT